MDTLKKWFKSDIALLLWRILLLYGVWFVAKIVFYLYNLPIIGDITGEELRTLLVGSFRFDTVSILYINALFIVLSLLPFRFRERGWYRKTLFWYYIVVNTVALAINLGDAIYVRYTQTRFTADEIFFAENDNTLQLIFKFAGENWYLVVVWIALVAAMTLLYGRKLTPSTPIRGNTAYYTVNTAILLAAIPVCIAGIRGGNLKAGLRPIAIPNATLYTIHPGKVNLILSNPFCILRPLGESNGSELSFIRYYDDTEELDSLFTPYHYPAQGDSSSTRGMLEGYNVVVMVLESFSAEHSAFLNPDLYPDGGGYTPFLDSLMREGLTFHRGYANGMKSVGALPSVLASTPSYKTSFMLLPESLGEGDQLPKIFDRRGYRTLFFNGSLRGSMGFEAYGRLAGIKEFYSMDEYVARHGDAEDDGVWGIWDEAFLDYMGEILDQTPQPFMSTIFTISSHHPFMVPDKYKDMLPKGVTKIQAPVAYTDYSLRKFFEKYADSEWMKRTLFVFTADHVSSERWAEKTKTPLGLQHIVAFMYTPDGSLRGQIDEVFQQIDIMPTVLGLTGYNEPYFGFGRDIFNEPERTPLVVTYNSIFQGIADSLTLYFDEHKLVGVYDAADKLLENDIQVEGDSTQAAYEQLMKAVIQQYYEHVSRHDYIVKERQ